MNILYLPPEVILNILSRLHWPDLLRTSSACKIFNDALKSSSQLRYKISLGCSGFEENCSCSACDALSFTDREQRLLRLAHSWATGTIQSHVTIVSPNRADWHNGVYDLNGGFLARCQCSRSLGTSVLEVIKLPSAVHACEMERIEYKLDFVVQELAINAAANVIALLEWPDQEDALVLTVHIHLRTLSNMENDLGASDSLITYAFEHASSWKPMSMQFYGAILVANFTADTLSCLVFWDWRRGMVVGDLNAVLDDEINFSGVSMISESTFLVPNEILNCINVFTLQPGHDPVHTGSFSLPETGHDIYHGALDCTFRSPSVALQPTLGSLGRTPFRIAYEESQIMTFAIRLWDDRDELGLGRLRTTLVYLVTPVSTFLAGHPSSSGPRHVPWDEWGPMHTRLLPYQGLPLNPFITFTSGTRMVLLGERRHGTGGVEQDIDIFDFNQRDLRRTRVAMEGQVSASRPEPPDDLQRGPINWSPSTLRGGVWHEVDITTSLPYRCTVVTVQGKCDALMIDEENILTFRAEVDMSETLTVMHIGHTPATASPEGSDDKVWIKSKGPPAFAAIQDTPCYLA